MMFERDVPTPKPTANEEVHRLDAEAEAWMAEHAVHIINAWANCGDPTESAHWSEAAVRQHWPELWSRWRALAQARDRLKLLMENEDKRRRNSRPG